MPVLFELWRDERYGNDRLWLSLPGRRSSRLMRACLSFGRIGAKYPYAGGAWAEGLHHELGMGGIFLRKLCSSAAEAGTRSH